MTGKNFYVLVVLVVFETLLFLMVSCFCRHSQTANSDRQNNFDFLHRGIVIKSKTVIPVLPNYTRIEYPRFLSLFKELNDPIFAWCAIDRSSWHATVLLCIYENGTIIWNACLDESTGVKFEYFSAQKFKTEFFYRSCIEQTEIENFRKTAATKQAWKFNEKCPLVPNESPMYTIFFREKGNPTVYLRSNIGPMCIDTSFGKDFLDEWKYFVESSKNMIQEKKEKFESSEFIFVRMNY
ncbi:MAG: hypothetical protein LBE12_15535 [Planctomycetaceae bacterium]|jgi:hypothetical protein|nr:hypothetical protein [Planctomycetaceae bacterium]